MPEREEQEAEKRIVYKPDCRGDHAHKINVADCLSWGEGCEEATMKLMDEGWR